MPWWRSAFFTGCIRRNGRTATRNWCKSSATRTRCASASSKIFLRAQQHEAAKNWVAANTELEKAQEALDAQPELRADELRAEVRRRLGVVRHELREQEHAQQAQKRRGELQGPHNDALFYYTLFTGMDAGDNRANALAATRSGLAVYGLAAATVLTNGGPTLLERDWPYLSAVEQTEVAGDLLRAAADLGRDSRPPRLPAGPNPKPKAGERAAKALALLARAARFGQAHGLETRTYHLRKGRYTARSKGEAFDPAALGPAVPARPTGSLDWFLEGLDAYRAGHYEQARLAFREVLEKQENHFWGRYVQGLCQLRLRHWVEAKASLTICMNLRREFVWPRLLRGFAASEWGFKNKDEKQVADAEFDAAKADFDLALKQSQDPLVQYVGLANRGVLNIRRRQWAERDRRLAAGDQRQAGLVPRLCQPGRRPSRATEVAGGAGRAGPGHPAGAGHGGAVREPCQAALAPPGVGGGAGRFRAWPLPANRRTVRPTDWSTASWSWASCCTASGSMRKPWPASIGAGTQARVRADAAFPGRGAAGPGPFRGGRRALDQLPGRDEAGPRRGVPGARPDLRGEGQAAGRHRDVHAGPAGTAH